MTLRRRAAWAAGLALAGGALAHPGAHPGVHPGVHPDAHPARLEPSPPGVPGRLRRARQLTAVHRFEEARLLLEALVRDYPREAGAWVALGDVARVQGRWAQARGAAFQAMRHGAGLLAQALAAAVGAGPVGARLRTLERALDEAGPGAGNEAVGYSRGIAAELAVRLGRPEVARTHLEVGRAVAQADPVLRAQAAELMGSRGSLYRLRLRLRGAWAGDDPVHARERARYLLEIERDAAGALAAARENWSRQREGEDACLLLEAAIAAGRPTEAAPVLAWAEGYGEDVRLASSLSQVAAAVAGQP